MLKTQNQSQQQSSPLVSKVLDKHSPPGQQVVMGKASSRRRFSHLPVSSKLWIKVFKLNILIRVNFGQKWAKMLVRKIKNCQLMVIKTQTGYAICPRPRPHVYVRAHSIFSRWPMAWISHLEWLSSLKARHRIGLLQPEWTLAATVVSVTAGHLLQEDGWRRDALPQLWLPLWREDGLLRQDNKYSSISCVIPMTLFGVLSDISPVGFDFVYSGLRR